MNFALTLPDANEVDNRAEIPHDPIRPMIQSLRVKNFRCFENLELNDLGRFNIIVGDNGAGKTALLESLFIPGGGHDMAFRLRAQRGIFQPQVTPHKAAYEALWRDLFFKFSQTVPIEISLQGSPENNRTLRIYYSPETSTPVFVGFQKNDPSEPSTFVPLVFETQAGGTRFLNQAIFDFPAGGGMPVLKRTGNPPPNAVIGLLASGAPFDVHSQFSKLDVKNEKGELVEAVSKVFPNIKDISLQTISGSPELFCTVQDLAEKIPIGLASNGINKYLAILVAIADNGNGAVLIDEIENGIYHRNFTNVWRGVLGFCKRYNVQLFSTTHSKECLNSLQPFIKESESDFRLIRAETSQNGSHGVTIFSGKDFESALFTGVDPR